jgi:hypothetical protein
MDEDFFCCCCAATPALLLLSCRMGQDRISTCTATSVSCSMTLMSWYAAVARDRWCCSGDRTGVGVLLLSLRE